ncbi:hypothetical protein SPRG_21191 [Saprolegnia parasitica CBS 223.65]|uniref:Secreted protein n=1 Tax=Saprolegnia parasitica (strain CBS 223.65) TaxID=695850 RepID=A0A067BZP1_SAPPC|nr:hypothetical protein SPRG_21191 [Saprolegnia parasitica CBS 223.65]KDO22320.1 hypothetical protein SPRG_21191 [Saprolegnia parasitica CBS 223.65]|eukprot:XP_012206985.1 hypothetical protein SPRG_21191 [Saprolegnia parasitica CBS 223.65]
MKLLGAATVALLLATSATAASSTTVQETKIKNLLEANVSTSCAAGARWNKWSPMTFADGLDSDNIPECAYDAGTYAKVDQQKQLCTDMTRPTTNGGACTTADTILYGGLMYDEPVWLNCSSVKDADLDDLQAYTTQDAKALCASATCSAFVNAMAKLMPNCVDSYGRNTMDKPGLDERFAYVGDDEDSSMETLLAAPVLADTTLASLAAFRDARALRVTIAPPTLRFLAHYKLCMAEAAITDADILAWIERELAETTPTSIEAIVQHYRAHLVMDMRIPDARARVASYFMRANEMADANNFHFAGANLFCAMLVEGVRPRALRRDVELLLHVPSNAHAKCDDRRLFDLDEASNTADYGTWRSPDELFL